MGLVYWLGAIAGGVVVAGFVLYAFGRWLESREPYRSFLRLKARQKLTFFRHMMSDSRVPLFAKAIPILLVLYLAMPIDIIPDFIPVLGYVDDVAIILVALALVVRFTPKAVIGDLLKRSVAQGNEREKS